MSLAYKQLDEHIPVPIKPTVKPEPVSDVLEPEEYVLLEAMGTHVKVEKSVIYQSDVIRRKYMGQSYYLDYEPSVVYTLISYLKGRIKTFADAPLTMWKQLCNISDDLEINWEKTIKEIKPKTDLGFISFYQSDKYLSEKLWLRIKEHMGDKEREHVFGHCDFGAGYMYNKMYVYKTERELAQYFADKKRIDTHCFCMSTISYPLTYDTKEHQIYRIIGGIARRLPDYKNGLDWMYRERDDGGVIWF